MTTTVYTDGACLGNPGPGGWAWAVPDGAYASGVEAHTTNQRMEIAAALEAVQALPGPLRIVSDSRYVVDCFEKRWYVAWEATGWKTANRTPVKNQDLWRPLIDAVLARDIAFEWVKGHSGDAMNDIVDALATEAARTQSARGGSGTPQDLGPADDSGATPATAAAGRLSDVGGWRVVVLGHRPPELGGYDPANPIARRVVDKATEVLAALRVVHPDIVVLTGLDLGAEQLGAEAAAAAGVPYAVVSAYPEPDRVWPAASRERYQRLASGATATITLSKRAPKSKQEAGIALGKRNDALVAAAHGALVVWDGVDKRIGSILSTLERRLDDVWVIAPT